MKEDEGGTIPSLGFPPASLSWALFLTQTQKVRNTISLSSLCVSVFVRVSLRMALSVSLFASVSVSHWIGSSEKQRGKSSQVSMTAVLYKQERPRQ